MNFSVSKRIDAPPAAAFAAFTDFAAAPARLPAIKQVELLTPGPAGVGTRFRETRTVFGRDATETFEVAEWEAGRRVVLTAVSCGVEYRAEYRFAPDGDGTRLEFAFRGRPVSLFARLMRPVAWLMAGPMRKAIAADLDAMARSVEAKPPLAA